MTINERLLIDQADGLINEIGSVKLAIHKEDHIIADYHLERLLNNVMDLRRTLFLETHRSSEVAT